MRIPGPEPSSTPCDECGPRSFHRLLPDRQSSDGWELTTRFTCLQPAAGKVDQFAPRDRSCRQYRTAASSRTVSKRASRSLRAAGNCHRFASMNLIDGTTRQTSALMPSALAMWRAFAAERPARRTGDRPNHKPSVWRKRLCISIRSKYADNAHGGWHVAELEVVGKREHRVRRADRSAA